MKWDSSTIATDDAVHLQNRQPHCRKIVVAGDGSKSSNVIEMGGLVSCFDSQFIKCCCSPEDLLAQAR